MMVYVNTGLSLTLILTMTSFEMVLSGAPIFQLANQNPSYLGTGSQSFVRRARNAYRHMPPCVFLPQLSGIKSRFEQWMDKNQDGRADFGEVKAFLRTLKASVPDEIVTSFIDRRDENGNGVIDLVPEYIKEVVGNDYGVQAATEWFYLHDVNSDGYVSKPELVRLGMTVGMTKDQAEDTAAGYYLPSDQDNDGQLDFEEFSQLYEPPPSSPPA